MTRWLAPLALVVGITVAAFILAVELARGEEPEPSPAAYHVLASDEADAEALLESDKFHIEVVDDLGALIARLEAGQGDAAIFSRAAAEARARDIWSLHRNRIIVVLDMQWQEVAALARGDELPDVSDGGFGGGRYLAHRSESRLNGGFLARAGSAPLSALESLLLDQLPRLTPR